MPGTAPQVTGDQRARGLRAVVSSFARGIVDNVAPDQIPDDAVADALNVEFDRLRNLRTRQGCAKLNWNGNLVGSIAYSFSAGWALSSAARDAGSGAQGPDGTAAELLLDSGAGLGNATAFSSELGVSQLWGASCYVRVPVDTLAPPATWDGTIPCLAIEFTGATAVGAGVCLVPDLAAEDGWKLAPAAGFANPVDYAFGESIEDPADDAFIWLQIIIHARNNASGNLFANLRLYPAYAAYTVSGGAFVVGYDGSGRVSSDNAAANANGVGFWGAVLERGRTPARRPSTSGTAATVAGNYLTGRVTSVFYYKTTDDDAIYATSGADLYRFAPSSSMFEKITNGLSFPSNTLWQWVVYDGRAYAVNRGAGVRASQTLTSDASNFADGNTVEIGAITYTFESGTLDAPYEVKLGADIAESLANLVIAIRGIGTVGVEYADGTEPHPDVEASAPDGTSIVVTAIAPGTAGDAIAVDVTSSNATWGDDFLSGGSGYANPIVIDDPGSDPTIPRGLPPPGRYVDAWNGRLWIVPEAEPWTLVGSKLGDAQDFVNTDAAAGFVGIEVGYQEKFDITGIHVHQGVLLPFKRDRIYGITPGDPNTDASKLRVDQLTRGVGSISGYAIRTLLEDVVFMSAYGLTALSLLEKFGVFRENVISRDVAAFSDPEVGTERAIVEVYPRKGQALCAFAPRLGTGNTNAYLLDYRGAASGDGTPPIAFTRLTGPPQAASACLADVDGEERMLLGGELDTNNLAHVWLYDDESSFADEGVRFPVSIVTKAYSWGDVFLLKLFHRWEALFELLEPDLVAAVTWRPDLKRGVFQQWRIGLEGQVSGGAKWDTAVWDVSQWAGENVVSNVFTGGRFAGSAEFGRYARALQAEISVAGEETGFVLKGFALAASWGRDVSARGSSGGFEEGDEEHAMVTGDGDTMETGEGDTAIHA